MKKFTTKCVCEMLYSTHTMKQFPNPTARSLTAQHIQALDFVWANRASMNKKMRYGCTCPIPLYAPMFQLQFIVAISVSPSPISVTCSDVSNSSPYL